MYVCVCHAVTDRQMRQAAAEGVCSLRGLRESLGLGSGCGRCIPEARRLLEQLHHRPRVLDLDTLPAVRSAA